MARIFFVTLFSIAVIACSTPSIHVNDDGLISTVSNQKIIQLKSVADSKEAVARKLEELRNNDRDTVSIADLNTARVVAVQSMSEYVSQKSSMEASFMVAELTFSVTVKSINPTVHLTRRSNIPEATIETYAMIVDSNTVELIVPNTIEPGVYDTTFEYEFCRFQCGEIQKNIATIAIIVR